MTKRNLADKGSLNNGIKRLEKIAYYGLVLLPLYMIGRWAFHSFWGI